MATTTERGYNAAHKARRRREARNIKAGHAICWRCTKPIPADTPSNQWDLGHDDNDRTKYMGPEHVACNRATTTHKALNTVDTSRQW